MDQYKKYNKMRSRMETVGFLIAFLIGNAISDGLDLTGKKLLSKETGFYFLIIMVLAFVADRIAVMIADHWYKKNKESMNNVDDENLI